MTTHRYHVQLSRFAIAGAFLIAGLVSAGQSATAGPPQVDDGGSGGSTTLSGPSLVGSGPEREIVANADEVPTLVGSGPEREIVADTNGQETAGTLSDADIAAIISASGGNGQAIFADSTLDETARSTSLIALYPTANVDVAIQHRGQPF